MLFLALGDAKVPDARYFAFWWNIGLKHRSLLLDQNEKKNSYEKISIEFCGSKSDHIVTRPSPFSDLWFAA